jgi:hypothetical protein
MTDTGPVLHIGTTVSGKWIWQLRSADKHVVNVSEPFDTRAECEADARKHGLKVVAKRTRRSRTGPSVAPVSEPPVSWRISEDASGLWRWERPGGEGEAASRCAFLTKRECLADAQKHGYSPDVRDAD